MLWRAMCCFGCRSAMLCLGRRGRRTITQHATFHPHGGHLLPILLNQGLRTALFTLWVKGHKWYWSEHLVRVFAYSPKIASILCLLMLGLLFTPKHTDTRIFDNHLNPVMLIFIGYHWSTMRWVPMCQGFNHFSGLMHNFHVSQICRQQHKG